MYKEVQNAIMTIIKQIDKLISIKYRSCRMCGACCCKKYIVGDQIYIDRRFGCPFMDPFSTDRTRKCLMFDRRLCPRRKDMFKFEQTVPEDCAIKPHWYRGAKYIDTYLFLESYLKLNPMPPQPRYGPCSSILHEPTAMELRKNYLISWLKQRS